MVATAKRKAERAQAFAEAQAKANAQKAKNTSKTSKTPTTTNKPKPRKSSNPNKTPIPSTDADANPEDGEQKEKKHRFIVFIGNLPYTATTKQIQQHFASVTPSSVRHSTDKTTGKSKGFAFLEFEDYSYVPQPRTPEAGS